MTKSKKITDSHIKSISRMIREWPDNKKLGWNEICEHSKPILNYVPTRQALSGKTLIRNTYRAKKDKIKQINDEFKNTPRPSNMQEAIKTIQKLRDENDLLNSELDKMIEIARIFIYNASIHGLSREQLSAPLPSVSE